MAMVLRSLYLDPQVDIDLGNRADHEGITKAELMRRYLAEGLRRPATEYAGYAKHEQKPPAALRSPSSDEFWRIDQLSGRSLTTTHGRIGTSGQTTVKSYNTDAEAKRAYDMLIAEKIKKGYQLVEDDDNEDDDDSTENPTVHLPKSISPEGIGATTKKLSATKPGTKVVDDFSVYAYSQNADGTIKRKKVAKPQPRRAVGSARRQR